jgi:lipid A ethanolaminephosphotransferase
MTTLPDPTAGRASDAPAPVVAASRFTMPATVEQVLLAASLFFALAANRPFLSLALHGHDRSDPSTWGFALAVVAWLAALHFIVMALLANRWTTKPLVGALIVTSALASYYMGRYGIQIDTAMMRNVLRTDVAEARELLATSLLPHMLLYAVLPLLLLWRVRLVSRPWRSAIGVRLLGLLVATAVLGGSLLLVFQALASLLRNHHEARHLITPANVVSALLRVAARDLRGSVAERRPIGLDAAPGPMAATRARPLLLVLVVGETARAANWGLNGYARQTTPQLAALPVINFAHVSSCGTSTEVSLRAARACCMR